MWGAGVAGATGAGRSVGLYRSRGAVIVVVALLPCCCRCQGYAWQTSHRSPLGGKPARFWHIMPVVARIIAPYVPSCNLCKRELCALLNSKATTVIAVRLNGGNHSAVDDILNARGQGNDLARFARNPEGR